MKSKLLDQNPSYVTKKRQNKNKQLTKFTSNTIVINKSAGLPYEKNKKKNKKNKNRNMTSTKKPTKALRHQTTQSRIKKNQNIQIKEKNSNK